MKYNSAWQAHKNHTYETACWYCMDRMSRGIHTFRFVKGPYMPLIQKPIQPKKKTAKDWYKELMK